MTKSQGIVLVRALYVGVVCGVVAVSATGLYSLVARDSLVVRADESVEVKDAPAAAAVAAPAAKVKAAKVEPAAAKAPEPDPAPQVALLNTFTAPSHLPPGEGWVLVGSADGIPADFQVTSANARAAVLEMKKLSDQAVAVRLQVPALGVGDLLRGESATEDAEAVIAVERGAEVPSRIVEANFSADDMVADQIVVPGPWFMYGYKPSGSSDRLAAVRIHNRANGQWYRREFAEARQRIEDERLEIDDPAFREPDPFVTLPDTDGDGIYDFDEEPEPRVVRADTIGIALEPGLNVLDIVAEDESGLASWKTLNVFSTYVEELKE